MKKHNFYLLKYLLSRNHWPCFQTEMKRLHTEENFPTNTVAVSFLSGENLVAITSCKSQIKLKYTSVNIVQVKQDNSVANMFDLKLFIFNKSFRLRFRQTCPPRSSRKSQSMSFLTYPRDHQSC